MNKKEFADEMEKTLYTVASYMDPDMRIEHGKDKNDKDGDKNE